MNPKDPLWHLPTRPRVANLIDELPDSFSDWAATCQVAGYTQRLKRHGLDITARVDGVVPVVCVSTPALKALLRAVYLDGLRDEEEDAKLRPVFAGVADALPHVDHKAEASVDRVMAERYGTEVRLPLERNDD